MESEVTASKQRKALQRVLCRTQNYWETFVDRVVSRTSTFGSSEVRQAFLEVLSDLLADDPKHAVGAREGFLDACRRVSIQQGLRELSALSKPDRLQVVSEAVGE